MRFFTLVISVVLSLGSVSGFGAEFDLAAGKNTGARMNETLPMQLDSITTWTQTSCNELPEKALELVYENSVEDGNAITQTELDSVLPSLIASWCFGPSLEPLMKFVDTIKYQYHFASGESIGELNFSFRDCFSKPGE